MRGKKAARIGRGDWTPEIIAKFTLINGCTKSARIAGQIRNDASGSRLSLLYSTLAELGVLGASVWSRRETWGYVGYVLNDAVTTEVYTRSGVGSVAGKKVTALDGGIDPLKL